MKVGVFENNLPMELEDLGNGYFNLYAPGQIDYKFIEDNMKKIKNRIVNLLINCNFFKFTHIFYIKRGLSSQY